MRTIESTPLGAASSVAASPADVRAPAPGQPLHRPWFGLADGDRAEALRRGAPLVPVNAARDAAAEKRNMLDALDAIAEHYDVAYGPKDVKQVKYGWTLEAALAHARGRIEAEPKPTVALFQQVVRQLIASMRDFHVSVSFVSTASAALPFAVVAVGDRFFLRWIDRDKLPESSFPFAVGDEVVSFDGRPILEVVRELEGAAGPHLAWTDRALAARNLTRRSGRAGDVLPPDAPVTVELVSAKTGAHEQIQLGWERTRADVRFDRAASDDDSGHEPRFEVGDWREHNAPAGAAPDPYDVGARQSYCPPLGVIVSKPDPRDPFESYIYRRPDGKLVGYIRIASYSVQDYDTYVARFAERIKEMQAATDALVIDQLSNPGGQFFFAYALASMLTDRPLAAPKHRIALCSRRVREAQETLAQVAQISDDKSARRVLGETWSGYPVTYTFAMQLATCARFIIKEFEAGKTMTDPVHLHGVDKINPSTVARYTKPIVMMINELDFSNGDFFPAIFQDNRRALLHGTTTAGAGGFVESYEMPNTFGVNQFRITGSVGVRVDGSVIESEGVRPDVRYDMTVADVQQGHAGLVTSVNDAVSRAIAAAA